MKKLFVLCLSLALLVTLSNGAFAYTIDGDLSDWGVTPFSSWTPSSSTAEWNEVNYSGPGSFPHGGEKYDAEAIYFDDDISSIYVALVVSIGPEGWSYGSSHHLMPGDLAIDLTSTDVDSTPFEYGFGIVNYDAADFDGSPYSGHGYNDHQFAGNLYSVNEWNLPEQHVGISANAPSTIVSGTLLGAGSLAYVNVGDLEGNGTDTYIVEMSIDKNLFGVPTNDQTFNLHWTMTCGNDVLNLEGTTGGGGDSTIPEPGSLMLVASGLLGLARYKDHFNG